MTSAGSTQAAAVLLEQFSADWHAATHHAFLDGVADGRLELDRTRGKLGLDLAGQLAVLARFVVHDADPLAVRALLNVNPIRALYWTAILNGLLAPFLLIAIVLVASDRNLMAGQPSSKASLAVVSLTALLMFAAALGLFVL